MLDLNELKFIVLNKFITGQAWPGCKLFLILDEEKGKGKKELTPKGMGSD